MFAAPGDVIGAPADVADKTQPIRPLLNLSAGVHAADAWGYPSLAFHKARGVA